MNDIDLILTRSPKRWSDLYLSNSRPAVVFSARIAQTFETLDGVVEITYDTATGNLADVLPGMTLKIGTGAGKSDVGCARIRKSPTDSTIFINQASELTLLQDNLHLTVIQDFGLWSKLPVGSGASMRMDYDLEYDPVAANAPVPVLGPMVTVLRMTGASISHSPDASASWSPIGAELSYQWYAPGARATADMDTANPAIGYDADGEYLEYCVVTDEFGGSSTGYRKVLVNPPAAVVTFGSLETDVDAGGLSLGFTGVGGLGPGELEDRSLVILWCVDHVGSEEITLGPVTEAENILFTGWVDGQTIHWGTNYSTVEFTAHGPAWWLGKIGGAAVGLTNTASPTTWEMVNNLSFDYAIYRLVHFYCTITAIMDVLLTGDTKVLAFANLPGGMLWQQLKNYSEQTLIAFPQVDEYGRLFIEVPASLLPNSERVGLPVLIDLTSADFVGQVDIEWRQVQEKGMIEIGGLQSGGGTAELYSRAPGNLAGRFGSSDAPYTALVVSDQTDCDRLCGAYLAWKNNAFPSVGIQLKYDLRHLRLCPRSILRLTMAASDNPLGLTWTNKRLVPIAYSREYNAKSGKLLISITCEAETTGAPGVAYYPPSTVDTNVIDPFVTPEIDTPDIASVDIPPNHTWYPPSVTQIPDNIQPCSDMDVPNGPVQLTWNKPELNVATGVLSAKAACACKIRSSAAILYPTQLQINGIVSGGLTGKIHCYALSANGTRLITGAMFGNLVTFAPAVATRVAGFELVMDPDAVGGYFPGPIITSGEVQGNDTAGVDIPLTDGLYYCIDGTGGPWYYDVGQPTMQFYNFNRGAHLGHTKGVGYSATKPGMCLDIPTGCAFVEAIDSHLARVYLRSDGSPFNFVVSDEVSYADNGGSLGYILRSAFARGGGLRLSSSQCWNICK